MIIFFFFSIDYKEKTNKNFYTNPAKRGKGNTTVGHLFDSYNHMPDPYERLKEQELVFYIMLYNIINFIFINKNIIQKE